MSRQVRVKLFSTAIRRFTMPADTTFLEFLDRCRESGQRPTVVQYLDDEDDWVTVSSELEWKQGLLQFILAEAQSSASPSEGESGRPRLAVFKIRVSFSPDPLHPTFMMTSTMLDSTVIDPSSYASRMPAPSAPSPPISSPPATPTIPSVTIPESSPADAGAAGPSLSNLSDLLRGMGSGPHGSGSGGPPNQSDFLARHGPALAQGLGSGLSQLVRACGGWGPFLQRVQQFLPLITGAMGQQGGSQQQGGAGGAGGPGGLASLLPLLGMLGGGAGGMGGAAQAPAQGPTGGAPPAQQPAGLANLLPLLGMLGGGAGAGGVPPAARAAPVPPAAPTTTTPQQPPAQPDISSLLAMLAGGAGQQQQTPPQPQQQQQQTQPNWGDLASSFFSALQQGEQGGQPQTQTQTQTRQQQQAPLSKEEARLNFADELKQLRDMGFLDEERNLGLLMKFAGDLVSVIQELMGSV